MIRRVVSVLTTLPSLGPTAAGTPRLVRTFNPEVGFLSRTNYEKVDFSIFIVDGRKTLGVFELRPHMYHRSFFDNEGFYVSGFTHVDNHWEWRNGLERSTQALILFTKGVQKPFEINEGTFVSRAITTMRNLNWCL